jgi:hypothetical protein
MDGLNVGPYDEMEIYKVNPEMWKALVDGKRNCKLVLRKERVLKCRILRNFGTCCVTEIIGFEPNR